MPCATRKAVIITAALHCTTKIPLFFIFVQYYFRYFECICCLSVIENRLSQEHSDQSHKKFKCASCDRSFGSKWDQNRHFKKCPKNPEREITCKRCIAGGCKCWCSRWYWGLSLSSPTRSQLWRVNGFVRPVINCILQKNV